MPSPRSRFVIRLPFIALALLVASACSDDEGPAGPTPPPSALRFQNLDVGYFSACGLTRAGAAYCWGWNVFGALGDGTRDTRLRPVRVAGGHVFEALDVGAGHACGVTAAGPAWCWGQNDEGQLGDGSFAIRDEPVAVAGGHEFVSISAGHAHSCALTAEGVAWCWGDDSAGQLGDGAGASPRSEVPVRVQFEQPFRSIHAGYYQTCALDMEGRAWCWGSNTSGQNGDGSEEARHAPVPVATERSFSALAPGDRFVCGISDWTRVVLGRERVRPARYRALARLAGASPHRRGQRPGRDLCVGRRVHRRRCERIRLRHPRRWRGTLLGRSGRRRARREPVAVPAGYADPLRVRRARTPFRLRPQSRQLCVLRRLQRRR